MRRRRESEAIETPELNITPLIDVVFVILVAFILIAPLFEMDNVTLADGGVGTEEVDAQSMGSLQITVKRDNTILFNALAVSLEELKELVAEEKIKHPDERPKLLHDKHAYFGTYQDVKNILASAGYEELDIVLNPCKN